MSKNWRGETIADLHTKKIKQKELAAHMNLTSEYVCMVLGGNRAPQDMEKRMKTAIAEIVKARETNK